MHIGSTDTIAAISTPPGRGGIGVIRLSGKDSLALAKEIFGKNKKGKGDDKFISHKACYGTVVNPKSGEAIDEAVLTFFKSPKSYTCEDMVELSMHGSPVVLEEALKLLLDRGARLAEPGEFTKRAYLNKRMDLVQAEAIAELINSKSLLETKFILRRIKGELSSFIDGVGKNILELLSELEAEVDFPEENLDFESSEERKKKFENVEKNLKKLLASYENSRSISSGISASIVGVTNAGKSTLFNALLKRNRAIISDTPGTTRDYIFDEFNLKNLNIKLFDTAGLNFQAKDDIEKSGIEKTIDIIDKSDLLLIVLEKGKKLSNEEREIIESANGKEKIIVLNKADLPGESRAQKVGSNDVIEISALKGSNLELLETEIEKRFSQKLEGHTEAIMISSLRQKLRIEEALNLFSKARESLMAKASPEFIVFDLKAAYRSLLGFKGTENSDINDDILNNIFSNFCIGK